MIRLLAFGLMCVATAASGETPRTAMANCEYEANKLTLGMVSADSGVKAEIETKRRELIRSCMVSKGFSFDAKRYKEEHNRLNLYGQASADFAKRVALDSDYWK